jgi:hypothetical protein
VIVQFEQYALTSVERRGAAIETEFTTGSHRLQGTQADGDTIVQRSPAKIDQLIGTDEDLGQGVPKRLALAETDQILSGQIEIGDDQILIERDDSNAKPAENALGTGCLVVGMPGRGSGRSA